MSETVTVLGAGIVGICTALSLAERGMKVRVIDRGAPGQETSYGNAGIISPWSIVPQAVPGIAWKIPQLMFGRNRALSVRAAAWPSMVKWGLAFLKAGTLPNVHAAADAMELLCGPSIEIYQRHLAGTGQEHLLADSMYVHAFRDGSKASLSSLEYAIRQERGADVALIGKAELHALEPALSPDFQAAVLIKGQARARSPGQICEVLADKAKLLGVHFEQAEIRSLSRRTDGWKILCQGRDYMSDKIVLAMGVWSAELMKSLGYSMPLMAERGYHLEFPDPQIELNNSVMDVDAKCVASSMVDGLRFAGQAEFAPIDAAVDQGRRAHLSRLARSALPGLNLDGPKLWMGRRPSFPDSLPVLDALSDKEGLYLNFGHSHYGLMMAPKSGEVIADLIAGRKTNTDLSAFSFNRFKKSATASR